MTKRLESSMHFPEMIKADMVLAAAGLAADRAEDLLLDPRTVQGVPSAPSPPSKENSTAALSLRVAPFCDHFGSC